jgi:hypothetical protein
MDDTLAKLRPAGTLSATQMRLAGAASQEVVLTKA